jgi:serine/threonine protein kinase
MPDERTLREFLLGQLSLEHAAQVEAWLSSDPAATDTLCRLTVDDPLTQALADTASVEMVPARTIEWIIPSVLQELGSGNTPSPDSAQPTPFLPRKSPTATPPLPPKLGGYRVVREIGRGGMGVVLEADDDKLQRRVAIKVMARDRAQDPEAKARFVREARAAAAIEHENVVPIYHVGEDEDVPFIVMPLLRGESLAARLKREQRLSATEVIRLGREVAAGLAAAHTRGLVHRDVKPANVWLASPSTGSESETKATRKAILLDFGLARVADGTDGLTAPGAIPGTPAYLAPEQVDGEPADARSDLFSLGATLYQCATGQPAFAGPTLTAILRAVTAHHPPPPHLVNPTVPAPLSDLIMRLLAKEPSARPQSAQQVVDDLAALGETPTATDVRPAVSVPSPRTQQQGGNSTGWRRWLVPIAAGVLLAGLGGWLLTHLGTRDVAVPGPAPKDPPSLVRYRGQVDVLIERADEDGKVRLLRLNEPRALPLRKTDKFRIEGRVDPPAYLYVVWVDPGHDVTPVYPWDPTTGWGSRPAEEKPVGRVSLPRTAGNRYTAPEAKVGVATMVLFARPTPLDAPDEVVRGWFENLPELPLPVGGEKAAVWFDDYVEVRDPDRLRTFVEVGADDAFARWQGHLQAALGSRAVFQTSVSFARTGRK